MAKKKTKKRLKKRSSNKSQDTQKRFLWMLAGGLLVLTFIVYFSSLQNGFVNWDDPTYISENPLITNPTPANTRALLIEPVSLNYHPVTMLSLALNYKIGGLNPYSYHLFNLLLHLLNTVLIFYFVYWLSGKKWIVAVFTAALFAIHPMHVESVAWVSERKDVLYVGFFMTALLFYSKYLKAFQSKFLIYTLIFFLLSCLSKAMAVVFPVVLLLIDYYLGRKWDKRLLLEKIPFFALSLLFGIMAINIQSNGAINEFDTFSLWQRMQFAGYGFTMYLIKLIAPFNLTTFYPYPNLTESGGLPLIFPALLGVSIVLVGAAIYRFRQNKLYLFSIGFYLITVALVLQFLSVGKALMADRYTYLPYVGIFFLLGMGLDWLINKKKNLRMPLLISAGIVIIFFSILTHQRIKVWKDTNALFSDAIAKYPNSGHLYAIRGSNYGKTGKIDLALKDLEIAVQLGEENPNILKDLGNAYASKQQFEKAESTYAQVIEIEPDKPDTYINRATCLSIQKKYSEAFKDFEKALSLNPSINQKVKILVNRSFAYTDTNQPQKALEDAHLSVNLSPNDGSSYHALSYAYSRTGDFAKALQYARKSRNLGYRISDAYIKSLENKQ